MSKITTILSFIFLSLIIIMISVSVVFAATGGGGTDGYLENPLGSDGPTTLYGFVAQFLNVVVVPLGAVVAVFFTIYTGFLFVTAQGNPEKLNKAKTAFLWVVIGTAILLGAWVIATGVGKTICEIRGGNYDETSNVCST